MKVVLRGDQEQVEIRVAPTEGEELVETPLIGDIPQSVFEDSFGIIISDGDTVKAELSISYRTSDTSGGRCARQLC